MKNKIQLNALFVDGLFNPQFVADATQKYVRTIAGVSDIPLEITDGITIYRQNIRSTHEEANVMITQHAISSSMNGKRVTVMCKVTDVFVLLLHFYHKYKSNGLPQSLWLH